MKDHQQHALALPMQSRELPEPELGLAPVATREEPATILLVDDEGPLRNVLHQMLRLSNFAVLAATNGLEALEKSAHYAGKIDLLLTDVVMPGMRGPELAELMLRGRPDTKVLFMSGFTDEEGGKTISIPSHYRLLQKPFSLTLLITVIEEVLAEE